MYLIRFGSAQIDGLREQKDRIGAREWRASLRQCSSNANIHAPNYWLDVKLGFEESQAVYDSGSQQARVWTEQWVANWMYCPNCGASQLSRFPANSPVADFFCATCSDQFEVKGKNAATFGRSVPDGAFDTKIARLTSETNPNLLLIAYSKAAREVQNVCVVPKHFFVPEIIEKRKPLAKTARRAGWVGSNILLREVPEAGRIFVLRDSVRVPRDEVLAKWKQTAFLRGASADSRGWLVEVMKSVEMIGKPEFTLNDVYAFDDRLSAIYPNNHNVRPKIRQQLQVLRDHGYLEFLGSGRYRIGMGKS